jgi:hypothetical protein
MRDWPLEPYPRYGYCAEIDGRIVASIFTIFSRVEGRVFCQLIHWASSVPVLLGHMLAKRALSHPDVTYLVQAHTPDVEAMLRAQRYERFSSGRHVAPFVPGLKTGTIVQNAGPLLNKHRAWNCLSFTCDDAPFIFLPRRVRGIRFARLIYCRSLDELRSQWRALSRHLLARGYLFCQIDSDGPVEGIAGRFVAGWPKYWQGAGPEPRAECLPYSARVLFDN